MKIQNQEACNEAMQKAWDEFNSNINPNWKFKYSTSDFAMGFKYAWMIVEAKEAEIDLLQSLLEQGRSLNKKLALDLVRDEE